MLADSPLSLLLSLSPGAMGAGSEVRRGLAGVIASYRQADDCHSRPPEDIETGATSEARRLPASLPRAGRFPSPSH